MKILHRLKKTRSPLRDAWNTIERIQYSLDLNNAQLAELMCLTLKQLMELKRTRVQPSAMAVFALAESLNIPFESIFTGTIDFPTLIRHYWGDRVTVPDRYAIAGQSRKRSSINILNYIESTYGWQRRALIMRRLQMNESMLQDPDEFISVQFPLDLVSYLYERDQDPQDLIQIGRNSAITYTSSPIGQNLSNQKDLRTAYELTVSELIPKFLEKNFVWSLQMMDSKGCIIVGRPDKNCEDLRASTNPLLCHIRIGFVSSISAFLGMPFASVRKTACVALGDDHCRMEVDFDKIDKAAPSVEMKRPLVLATP